MSKLIITTTLVLLSPALLYGQVTVIFTPSDLDAVRTNLAGNYQLGANIDLANSPTFAPIGDATTPFTGSLDGNGYSITNYTYAGTVDVGLFGVIDGGSLTNVTLSNVNVSGFNDVGGLVGRALPGSTLTGCRVTGIASGLSSTGGLAGRSAATVRDCLADVNVDGTSSIGGLIGYIDIDSVVENCSAHGDVVGGTAIGGLGGTLHASVITRCVATGSVDGFRWVGGLIGKTEQENTFMTQIIECFATGEVLMRESISGVPGTGGLLGQMDPNAAISRSFATGAVYTRDTRPGLNVGTGGLVGVMEVRTTVTDSYALGDVLPDPNVDPNNPPNPSIVGGLVGRVLGEISNSFAHGNIVAHHGAGGLAGSVFSSTIAPRIERCYAAGNVTVYSQTSTGLSIAGGLVGSAPGSSAARIAIVESYAAGDVVCTGTGRDVGGLVGGLRNGDVIECFASGNVTSAGIGVGGLIGSMINTGPTQEVLARDSYALGNVTYTGSASNARIGGLVGDFGQNTNNVINCYSVGLVDEGLATTGFGGLIGINGTGLVTASFWDTTTSGQTTSAGGTGRTTMQMMQQATFDPPWDFTNVWDIVPNTTYPFLQWE